MTEARTGTDRVMRLRNPDRRGIEIVALIISVILVLVVALVVVDALHVH